MGTENLIKKIPTLKVFFDDINQKMMRRMGPERRDLKLNRLMRNDDLNSFSSNEKSMFAQYVNFVEKYEGEREYWPLTIFWDTVRLGGFVLYCDASGKSGQTIANKVSRLRMVIFTDLIISY
jgi:hypothetical protein